MADTTMPRRILGRQLLLLRGKRSRSSVSKKLKIGESTLWRYESGVTIDVKPYIIRELCRYYEASQDMTDTLLDLAEAASKPSWWYAYDAAMPGDFEIFIELEQSASHIRSFQLAQVPGLVQTAAYRRATTLAATPDPAPERVDQIVELAMKRQARLDESESFRLDIVLDESVLRRTEIGGPDVMREQLEHLIAVSERPNVSIRVVPLTRGYLGLETGRFVLLEFPPQRLEWMNMPPMVYVEQFGADVLLGKDAEVREYRRAWAAIQKAAHDEDQSIALILHIAKELQQ